jgi:hypothetical protein
VRAVSSSYAKYCRDQAADCARRARIASSPEVIANCKMLQERWLKLASKADIESRRPALPASFALARRAPSIGAT